MKRVFLMLFLTLAACVDDTEIVPRVWHCLDSGGEVWTWKDTGYTDGEAQRECSRQAGGDCSQCSLDEVGVESAPYYCTCKGECRGVGTLGTDWSGSAVTKTSAQSQCVMRLSRVCNEVGGILDLSKNLMVKCQ